MLWTLLAVQTPTFVAQNRPLSEVDASDERTADLREVGPFRISWPITSAGLNPCLRTQLRIHHPQLPFRPHHGDLLNPR